jgi:hypothetical protein
MPSRVYNTQVAVTLTKQRDSDDLLHDGWAHAIEASSIYHAIHRAFGGGREVLGVDQIGDTGNEKRRYGGRPGSAREIAIDPR